VSLVPVVAPSRAGAGIGVSKRSLDSGVSVDWSDLSMDVPAGWFMSPSASCIDRLSRPCVFTSIGICDRTGCTSSASTETEGTTGMWFVRATAMCDVFVGEEKFLTAAARHRAAAAAPAKILARIGKCLRVDGYAFAWAGAGPSSLRSVARDSCEAAVVVGCVSIDCEIWLVSGGGNPADACEQSVAGVEGGGKVKTFAGAEVGGGAIGRGLAGFSGVAPTFCTFRGDFRTPCGS